MLGALLFVGVVVGVASDHYALGLLLVLIPYVAFHLFNLYRLDEWVRLRKASELPDVGGVYEELFHGISQLQRRSRAQKRRLTDLLSRFREATAAMPDATVVLRQAGEIEWFNSAASRLLNLRSQDIGSRIENLFRHPRFVQYLARRDYTQPLILESPSDAQISLHIHVVPYGDNQRLLIARDVTRMQRLEQIRRDFVANVSHELRTPLTVLTGFLETMADNPGDHGGPWVRQLELMRSQAARMQLIVEQLLLLSRLETEVGPPRREPINVPALLSSIRDEAIVLSGEKLHLITLENDTGLWLQGNLEELRSAMSNLVFNAVQYTPARGEIHIRWAEHDSGAQLSVRDTGIGIPAHHIPRLTERFYRVDAGRSRELGGTGLGLAIVKHVLQRHDATLSIVSETGQGSTFSCGFPAALVVRAPLAQTES